MTARLFFVAKPTATSTPRLGEGNKLGASLRRSPTAPVSYMSGATYIAWRGGNTQVDFSAATAYSVFKSALKRSRAQGRLRRPFSSSRPPPVLRRPDAKAARGGEPALPATGRTAFCGAAFPILAEDRALPLSHYRLQGRARTAPRGPFVALTREACSIWPRSFRAQRPLATSFRWTSRGAARGKRRPTKPLDHVPSGLFPDIKRSARRRHTT